MPNFFLVFFLLCAAAGGQPVTPSPAEALESKIVSGLLASREPAQLAWGAQLAANYRLRAFSDDLLRLATVSDWRVRMVATDSLIRLNIEVPEHVLFQMAENRIDDAIILMARKPDQYSRLTEQLLARKLENHYWVALNSILAAKPPAGFAASLLREWTIRLTADVYDPDTGRVGGGGGSMAVGCGGSFSQTGFPPLEAYYVLENPRPGDVMLANGPHPVGYRKQAVHERAYPAVDRDDYRRDYLLHLSMTSPAEASRMSGQWSHAVVEWKGEDAYRAETREILGTVRRSVEYLKNRLLDRRLLTAEEVERANPALDVQVVDRRLGQVPPLPVVRWALTDSGTP